MDRIVLEGMVFSGRHGARAGERDHAQDFTVDVEIESDLSQPGSTDQLGDTVDYTKLRAITKAVIEGDPVSLIETLAARIAAGILDLPMVEAVSVRVAKRPPSMMPITAAAVHIRRTRA
jgi:dihydroneopterin aldolase